MPLVHFPDYRLPDHTGTKRSPSEFQEEDPVALVLARGCCPKEHWQQVWVARLEPEVRVDYGSGSLESAARTSSLVARIR